MPASPVVLCLGAVILATTVSRGCRPQSLPVSNLVREFPALRGIEVAASWGVLVDTAPDLVPIISTIDAVSGLVIASGFSGHGFGIGAGSGLLASQLATGKRPVSILVVRQR